MQKGRNPWNSGPWFRLGLNESRGSALVVALAMTILVVLMAGSSLSSTGLEGQMVSNHTAKVQAQYMAEAGLAAFMAQFAGTSLPYPGQVSLGLEDRGKGLTYQYKDCQWQDRIYTLIIEGRAKGGIKKTISTNLYKDWSHCLMAIGQLEANGMDGHEQILAEAGQKGITLPKLNLAKLPTSSQDGQASVDSELAKGGRLLVVDGDITLKYPVDKLMILARRGSIKVEKPVTDSFIYAEKNLIIENSSFTGVAMAGGDTLIRGKVSIVGALAAGGKLKLETGSDFPNLYRDGQLIDGVLEMANDHAPGLIGCEWRVLQWQELN